MRLRLIGRFVIWQIASTFQGSLKLLQEAILFRNKTNQFQDPVINSSLASAMGSVGTLMIRLAHCESGPGKDQSLQWRELPAN